MAEEVALSGVVKEALDACNSVHATSLKGHIGENLLKAEPEELSGMVGNVATLLMAQAVCYMKSKGLVIEVLRADSTTFSQFIDMVNRCPAVGGVKMTGGRR